MYEKYVKRIVDFILALLGLIVLGIPFLILMLVIKLDSKGPVFFRQERIGKNHKHFKILKFRTMYIDTPKDVPTHMLNNPNACITKVGKILRKTSLDELPQIINIIRGEMSVIGPRPALWNQYDLIELRDKYNVSRLVPGLTGWAQINGRDEISVEYKAQLDAEYAENISFAFDVKCFFRTIFNVLKREGVQEGGPKEDEIRAHKSEEKTELK